MHIYVDVTHNAAQRPRDRAYSNPVPVTSGHRGPMVPQKRYKPHTSSDRRRYVEEVQLEEPIPFFMLKPEEEGIPLVDAMHNRFARLVGRDDQMFADRGPSISVRINVCSYHCLFCRALTSMVLSGPATHPGVGKSPRGISGTRLAPSPAPNWRRTWPSRYSASFR